MPLYEFICHDCTFRFERLMSFSQEESPVCPACQSANTLRQVSMPSIHFKGSGFYKTDTREAEDKKKEAKDADDQNESKEKEKQKSTETSTKTEKTKSTKKDKVTSQTSSSSKDKNSDSSSV